tara:strand:- start:698 stop:880 length:183 start_codon:yes stop_codon:yes gene_type:complete
MSSIYDDVEKIMEDTKGKLPFTTRNITPTPDFEITQDMIDKLKAKIASKGRKAMGSAEKP